MALLRTGVKRFLLGMADTYFERISVAGRSNVPRIDGKLMPCIYAGNHPSGLVDPVVLMAGASLFCAIPAL
jgi:1-acyl-sn-glycerol-3-phosphate acyltransferase